MITPTVGRKVWFFEDSGQKVPHDATVIAVNTEADGEVSPRSSCNLFVIDPEGNVSVEYGIRAGDMESKDRHFKWMPYQLKAQEDRA